MASEANAIFCRLISSFEGLPFFFSGSETMVEAGTEAAAEDEDRLEKAEGSFPDGITGGGGAIGALIGRTLNLLIY